MKTNLALVSLFTFLGFFNPWAKADYDRSRLHFLPKANQTLAPVPPPQMGYLQGQIRGEVAESCRVYAAFAQSFPRVGTVISTLEVFSSSPIIDNVFRLAFNMNQLTALSQREGYLLYFIGDENGNGVIDEGEDVQVIKTSK